MTKSLSNTSSEAAEQTNTTGTLSSILDITPRDGMAIALLNHVATGDAVGIPIYADLQNSSGDDLPLDTTIALRYESPSMDSPDVVSFKFDNIQPYRAHPITDQQSEEYIDAVKHKLKGNADTSLVVRDIDALDVAIRSTEQIDWTNSELYFDPNAVREFTGE